MEGSTIKATIITGLLILLLLAVFASADVSIAGPVNLNVDYSSFDEEDQINQVYPTETFTITNADTVNSANVTLSLSLLDAARYSVPSATITVSGVSTTISPWNGSTTIANIPANGTATVTFNVNATHFQSPGTKKIGTISYSIVGGTAHTVDLNQITTEMLIIKSVKVEYITYEDKTESQTVKDEATFSLDKDVKLGTDMTLTVEVKNLFSRDDYEYSDIDGIQLTLDAEDTEIFPNNFDTEYDLDDLAADKTVKYSYTLSIPEDIDTGSNYITYITFNLVGSDGKSIDYESEKKISFSLKRAQDDVRITKMIFTPEKVNNCAASTVALKVELHNYGSKDQKNAALAITNSALKINDNTANIKIEKYDDQGIWSKTLTFTVPKNTIPGTYPLDIRAFISNDEEADTDKANLVVEACPAPIVNTTVTTPPVTTAPAATTPATTATTTPVATTPAAATPATTATTATTAPVITNNDNTIVKITEKSYQAEDYLVGAMTIMILLILGLIVLLAVALFR